MIRKILGLHSYIKITALLTLLVAGVLYVYQGSLENGFHFDDRYSIVEHQPVHITELSVSALSDAAENAKHQYRQIPNVTFAIDWWRGNGDPKAFQQTNILIHGINAVIVFLLLFLIFKIADFRFKRLYLASLLLASLFWALHPIQVQGVTYIVQRMASMASLFMLLAVLFYLLARTVEQRFKRVLYGVLTLAMYVCGSLSKETAWITPLLLILAEYGIVRNRRELIAHKVDYAILGVPIIAGVAVMLMLMAGIGPAYDFVKIDYVNRDFTMEERLLTQPRVVLFYIGQVLIPLPGQFSIEHDFSVSSSLFTPWSTLPSMLIVIGWITIGVVLLLRKGLRIYGFFVLWLPLTLAVESSFIGLEMVFEHRMYLPLFAFSGLLLLLISYVVNKEKAAIPAVITLAVVCLLLGASTIHRLPVWQSTLSLLENSVKHAPSNWRSWSNLGRQHINLGDYDKAEEAIERAYRIAPQEASVLEAKGLIEVNKGNLQQAEKYYVDAYRTGNVSHSWLSNMATLHLLKARQGITPERSIQKALRFALQAEQAYPSYSEYVRNTATILQYTGQCSQAYQKWQQFYSMLNDPNERNRAQIYIQQNFSSPQYGCLPK